MAKEGHTTGPLMEAFGAVLRGIRTDRRISQDDFRKVFVPEISVGLLKQLESGSAVLSASAVPSLCQAFPVELKTRPTLLWTAGAAAVAAATKSGRAFDSVLDWVIQADVHSREAISNVVRDFTSSPREGTSNGLAALRRYLSGYPQIAIDEQEDLYRRLGIAIQRPIQADLIESSLSNLGAFSSMMSPGDVHRWDRCHSSRVQRAFVVCPSVLPLLENFGRYNLDFFSNPSFSSLLVLSIGGGDRARESAAWKELLNLVAENQKIETEARIRTDSGELDLPHALGKKLGNLAFASTAEISRATAILTEASLGAAPSSAWVYELGSFLDPGAHITVAFVDSWRPDAGEHWSATQCDWLQTKALKELAGWTT